MTPFLLTPLARRDLEEIWDYTAAHDPVAAERVLNRIERALRKLARQPGLGHVRNDLADQRHRFYLVYSYLIVYRPEIQPLQVVRILHASRDVLVLLGPAPGPGLRRRRTLGLDPGCAGGGRVELF